MTSEVASIPELVGSNYLAWKRKMIDVLRIKNIWRLVNGEHKTPIIVDDLAIWEAKVIKQGGSLVKLLQIVFR